MEANILELLQQTKSKQYKNYTSFSEKPFPLSKSKQEKAAKRHKKPLTEDALNQMCELKLECFDQLDQQLKYGGTIKQVFQERHLCTLILNLTQAQISNLNSSSYS